MKTAILSLALVCACGGGSPAGDGDVGVDAGELPTGRLFPLAIDAAWTYEVTDINNATVESKNQVVEAFEDVGGSKAGIMAFRLRTEKAGGGYTLSWQEDTGTAVIRHREQNFDSIGAMEIEDFYTPSKLRVDESVAHMAAGAAWNDSYQERTTDVLASTTTTIDKTDHWTVVSASESVTVPAGDFVTVHLRRTNDVTLSDKEYWFAPGVGKVKETGDRQVEELSAYVLP